MMIILNEWQLQLVDRVRSAGTYGTTREDVLNSAVFEHARYIATGGTVFDSGARASLEVDAPEYGPIREDFVIQPVTGKAVPVLAGEVLRISQVEGGTCVDYNAYNLHDYKEYLDCGFNRSRGTTGGKGTIVWTGSPRGRPMYAIVDHSDRFYQYYQGHRCNGIVTEVEYGFVNHPNCQDTFAETVREYGLTPDDVHDSYNLWMRTEVTPEGRRQYYWNQAQKDDYVDFLALMDTLSVPVICGGDISALNNFDPKPMRIQVFAPAPSTRALVDELQEKFGRFSSQQTPREFKKNDILAQRELVADPSYRPGFHPSPKKTTLELLMTPELDRQLEAFLATGNYLARKEDALLQAFFRWYDVTWKHGYVGNKLVFRKK
jgi:uncharacterized protein YcgI (DUF1989 family)